MVAAVTLALFTGTVAVWSERLMWNADVCRVMVLSVTTKLLETRLKIKGKRGRITEYRRFLIHIPSKIAVDSQFPFKPGQEITITVDPKGNIVLNG